MKNIQEKAKEILQFLSDETNKWATSRTHSVPYTHINCLFNVNMLDEDLRDALYDAHSNYYIDYIDGIDFDDKKQEVTVMIWSKKSATKKYKLKDYKQFCKDALITPPFEDDEQLDKWFEEHKIHLIVNDCDMELEYDADTINEIEFSLKEIYEAILGDGTPTTGNTQESRAATLKDLVQYYFLDRSTTYNDKEFPRIANDVLDVDWFEFYKDIVKNNAYDEYNDWIDCDFRTFNMNAFDLSKENLKRIVLDLVGTDYEIRTDGEMAFIIDHSLKIPGVFINWFYGADDKDEDIDAIAKDYIERYKKELFKEEA